MQRTRRGCTRALGDESQIAGYRAGYVRSTRTRDLGHSRSAEELWNRTLVTRTVTPVDPPESEALVRRKPAPRKAMATSLARSPRTSSNFTICRARRGRTHHRRAWKRATSLPTELAQLERRLLAPGRREFDDSAVEAAVAVAASPPPPLPFHSSARRCPKIPPAGHLTRSRDSPARSADPCRCRQSIPPRGETRFPPPDGHTKPLLSLFLSLSRSTNLQGVTLCLRPLLDFLRKHKHTASTELSHQTHLLHSRKPVIVPRNTILLSLLLVFFFFYLSNIRMWPSGSLSPINPSFTCAGFALRFSHPQPSLLFFPSENARTFRHRFGRVTRANVDGDITPCASSVD